MDCWEHRIFSIVVNYIVVYNGKRWDGNQNYGDRFNIQVNNFYIADSN